MHADFAKKLADVDAITSGFGDLGYICSNPIATALFIAGNLEKPLLVEGPAGVGKTELANTMAAYMGLPMIRLQCYEGLDEAKALYEWRYAKQLLYTQILRDKISEVLGDAANLKESMAKLHAHSDLFFSEQFVAPRPLLKALREEHGCVLLIDEIDKADHEFEAFLLEILSEYQVSIPELGTIKAIRKPIVFLTSNNTRELSDALKRRCLHLYVPFPEAKLERQILRARVPDITEHLMRQLVAFVQNVRELDLKKHPSVSETIDWARALMLLNASELDGDLVRRTLNVILKFEEDITAVDRQALELVRQAEKATPPPAIVK
jgi:MoxR-like ATPase